MLGMMKKGGGQNTPQGMGGNSGFAGMFQPQAQGGNPALAGLFRNNMPAAPGGMPSTLPQIMPPQRPNIGMPPKPVQPVQTTAPDDAAAQRLKMLQDMAIRNQQNGSGRAGHFMNMGTNPQWVGVGGRNAR